MYILVYDKKIDDQRIEFVNLRPIYQKLVILRIVYQKLVNLRTVYQKLKKSSNISELYCRKSSKKL